MKITRIQTLCLSRPHELDRQWVTARSRIIKADCAIVIIETDEGLTGVGEACAYGQPLIMREWVQWYGPLLVGRDPTDSRIVPVPHLNAPAPHPNHTVLRLFTYIRVLLRCGRGAVRVRCG